MRMRCGILVLLWSAALIGQTPEIPATRKPREVIATDAEVPGNSRYLTFAARAADLAEFLRPLPLRRSPCAPYLPANTTFSPSRLPSIKIRGNGSALDWYFTTYLSSHPQPGFTTRYYPGNWTPLGALPPEIGTGAQFPHHIPGHFATGDGLQDVQYSLADFDCSDRFGGSIKLRFVGEETFEYDARRGAVLWDFRGPELDLYIVPFYQQLNRAPTQVGTERIFAEFRQQSLHTYDIDSQGNIQPAAQDHASDLQAVFASVDNALRQNSADRFRRSVAAFAYGVIHDVFQDRLSGSNTAAMMELGDNHLEITTTPGTPYAYLEMRITRFTFYGDQDEEYRIAVGSCFGVGSGPCSEKSFDLEPGESSNYKGFFGFPVSRCVPNTRSILVGIVIRGEDLVMEPRPVDINCSALAADAAANRWGFTHVINLDELPVMADATHVGAFVTLQLRLTLQNR